MENKVNHKNAFYFYAPNNKSSCFAASSQDSEQTKVKIQKLISVSFALCTVMLKIFLIVTPLVQSILVIRTFYLISG